MFFNRNLHISPLFETLEIKAGICPVGGVPLSVFDSSSTQFEANVGIGEFIGTPKFEVNPDAVVQAVWLERGVVPSKRQVF